MISLGFKLTLCQRFQNDQDPQNSYLVKPSMERIVLQITGSGGYVVVSMEIRTRNRLIDDPVAHGGWGRSVPAEAEAVVPFLRHPQVAGCSQWYWPAKEKCNHNKEQLCLLQAYSNVQQTLIFSATPNRCFQPEQLEHSSLSPLPTLLILSGSQLSLSSPSFYPPPGSQISHMVLILTHLYSLFIIRTSMLCNLAS